MTVTAPTVTVHLDSGVSGIALLLAVAGLLISFGNVVWSVVSWRLTAGRVRASLSWAARAGNMLFTMAPHGEYPADYFTAQGATTPALAVEARNLGRSPVFVENYAIQCENGMSAGWVRGTGSLMGIPALPLKLEPGARQQFFVELDQVHGMIAAAYAIGKIPHPHQRAWMSVELGSGTSVRTKQEVTLRPPDEMVRKATDQGRTPRGGSANTRT